MIHWTRQIKEVLGAQDTLELSENATPLDEIEFWRNRCADLIGTIIVLLLVSCVQMIAKCHVE